MRKLTIIGLMALAAAFTSCHSNTQPPTNASIKTDVVVPPSFQYSKQWAVKYAGEYEIIVSDYKGNDAEVYQLEFDGTATWLWIKNYGQVTESEYDKKTGTWTAEENHITVNINGHSGVITEDYSMTNGKFVNDLYKKRTLKLIPKK
jgi:hypothetical protein